MKNVASSVPISSLAHLRSTGINGKFTNIFRECVCERGGGVEGGGVEGGPCP